MSLASWLADVLLLVHFAFAAFVVGALVLTLLGAALRWGWIRNPWFRVTHLAAIAVVTAQAFLGRLCPLTTWEMSLRDAAGDPTYEGSFVAHWLGRLLYVEVPLPVLAVAYAAFLLAVVAAWVFIRPRPFKARGGHAS